MIQSFADRRTRQVWERTRVPRLDLALQRAAHRKLLMLNRAEVLTDLRIPPGNRLEALRGDRAGQYSVRVNDQFRVCFTWTPAGPADVELIDYH